MMVDVLRQVKYDSVVKAKIEEISSDTHQL